MVVVAEASAAGQKRSADMRYDLFKNKHEILSMEDAEAVEHLHLGTLAIFSPTQLLIQCGLIFAALGQAIVKMSSDSPLYSWLVVAMLFTAVVSLSGIWLQKSVIALSSPKFSLLTKYSLGSLALRKNERVLGNTAWVRVRYDGYQQVFIEAGTRAYETTNLLRMAYLKGSGLDQAQKKCELLAGMWGIECKRQVLGSA